MSTNMNSLIGRPSLRQLKSKTTSVTCGKCKSNQIEFYQKQTRSGDEGMTIFYSCTKCGKNWRQ